VDQRYEANRIDGEAVTHLPAAEQYVHRGGKEELYSVQRGGKEELYSVPRGGRKELYSVPRGGRKELYSVTRRGKKELYLVTRGGSDKGRRKGVGVGYPVSVVPTHHLLNNHEDPQGTL